MRIKSKIDRWLKVGAWLTIGIMLIVLIMVPQQERLIGFGVGIPMICLLLWIYFGSFFEFRETYLLCRIGPFFQKIEYEKIKSIKLSESIPMSMALSRERIEITQHGVGFILGTTYISPMNRDEFFIELKKRCPNIKEDF